MADIIRTTVFTNGGSQAVRIPKAFRFNSREVSIQPFHGGILLMPIQSEVSLEKLFDLCDRLDETDKMFLDDRPCNVIPMEKDLFQ